MKSQTRINQALLRACKLALKHTSTSDEIPASVDHALKNAIAIADKAKPDANEKLLAKALEAVEALEQSLSNWVEIQDEEDAREYDQTALRKGRAVLRKAKGLKL